MPNPETPLWITVGLPLVTLILGAVGTSINDGRKDKRRIESEQAARDDAREADREARADDRLAEREKRRDTFEQEHLVKAYDALHRMMAHLLERRGAAKRGDTAPPSEAYPGREAVEEIRLILDDDLREQAMGAFQAMTNFWHTDFEVSLGRREPLTREEHVERLHEAGVQVPRCADLPRIWMPAQMRRWFSHLASLEADMRREIERYLTEHKTPLDMAVRIRCHPKLRVTAPSRMGSFAQARPSPRSWPALGGPDGVSPEPLDPAAGPAGDRHRPA